MFDIGSMKRSQVISNAIVLFFVAGLAFFGLSACSGQLDVAFDSTGQQPDDSPAADQTQQPRPGDPEQAFPAASGSVIKVSLGGRQLLVEEIDGELVFEGDILIPPSMVILEEVEPVYESGAPVSFQATDDGETRTHALTARTQAHWEDGVVPYSLDPNLGNPERVEAAIAHWNANTNLTFQERTTESDYLHFIPSSGCSSYIGKIGGKQPVYLSSRCSTGAIIHEIGHAIGLWHEQSRADRASYIQINWENIKSGHEHNFQTYAEMGFDGDEYTGSLDFGSVMMYGAYSFTKNGQPTIVKLDGSTFNVQRQGLSQGDIAGLESLYPEGGGEPEYVNGQFYTIAGLTVLRYYDSWYFKTKYGYKRVELRDGRWYWL